MNGYPKAIGTGQDLYNCLALVQSGNLKAADLRQTLDAIDARKWIHCSVVSISDDRKTVTVRYCNEADEGQAISTGAKIVTVEHICEEKEPSETKITLSEALPAGKNEVYIPAAASPLEELGITQDKLNGISEVLKQYE